MQRKKNMTFFFFNLEPYQLRFLQCPSQQPTTYKDAFCDLRQHCCCDDAVVPSTGPKDVETALEALLRAGLITPLTLLGTWQQLLPQRTQPLQ